MFCCYQSVRTVISGRNLVSFNFYWHQQNKKLKFIITADITSIAKVYGKAVQRNGDTYMDIEKMTIDFTMKNARFKVKDNVNSQNVLGKCSYFGQNL